MIRFFVIILLMGTIGAHAQSHPNDLEIFRLRDICQARANEMLTETQNGNTPQKTAWAANSNYSLKTHHCYVLIHSFFNEVGNSVLWLYDGNTRQGLAMTYMGKDGEKNGSIFEGVFLGKHNVTFDEASKFIEEKMATER